MIEKIPHPCKFSEFGCETRDLLEQLKLHEQKCNERTVKCPICFQSVQMKTYHEHTLLKGCFYYSEEDAPVQFILAHRKFFQVEGKMDMEVNISSIQW